MKRVIVSLAKLGLVSIIVFALAFQATASLRGQEPPRDSQPEQPPQPPLPDAKSATAIGDDYIKVYPWDMTECSSLTYCKGNTSAIIYESASEWFPADFKAKVQVDYGRTVYLGQTAPIYLEWFWDKNYTSDCKAALYRSSDGVTWTTLTTSLSKSVGSTWNAWGVWTTPTAINFRYLRVQVGQVAGQNCGWVGIKRLLVAYPPVPYYGALYLAQELYSYGSGTNYFAGRVGIGTTDAGQDKLDVVGRAYASAGWWTSNADYAEWFEKEEDTRPGDIIGLNLKTGKVRLYRAGDKFLGIHSDSPGFVGNRWAEDEAEMNKTHTLVGLLGQMKVNRDKVTINGAMVTTADGQEVGVLLSNGRVLIGR